MGYPLPWPSHRLSSTFRIALHAGLSRQRAEYIDLCGEV